jgi:hypothetical protein
MEEEAQRKRKIADFMEMLRTLSIDLVQNKEK